MARTNWDSFPTFWEGNQFGNLVYGASDWRTNRILPTAPRNPAERGENCLELEYDISNQQAAWVDVPCVKDRSIVLVEYPNVYEARTFVDDDLCLKCFCASNTITCDGLGMEEFPADVPDSVQNLFLDMNQLTMLKKAHLIGLTKLETLSLNSNAITSIEVGTFAESSLKMLSMRDNQLSQVPRGLFTSENLVYLDLTDNVIDEVAKEAFNGTPHLQLLRIFGGLSHCIVQNDNVTCVCNPMDVLREQPFCASCNQSYSSDLPPNTILCPSGITDEVCTLRCPPGYVPASASFVCNNSLWTGELNCNQSSITQFETGTELPTVRPSLSSSSGISIEVIAIVAGALVVVVILLGLVFVKRRQHRVQALQSAMQEAQVLFAQNFEETLGTLPDGAEDLVFLPSDIELGSTLGEGNYGVVYRAQFQGQTIAVKRLSAVLSRPARVNFMLEACLLTSLQHDNVVSLLGIVLNPPMILTEYMAGGDLREYLRACKPSSMAPKRHLLASDLLFACVEVCKALVFISSKQLIHRDIAARNVLVGRTFETIKLGDFGLARRLSRKEEVEQNVSAEQEYYRQHSDDAVAVRWLAPESVRRRVFTTKSDVWSFGVFMWETFEFGNTPFGNWSGLQVVMRVAQGERLPQPSSLEASPELYEIMTSCWQFEPSARPTFEVLLQQLAKVEPESAV
eukprot:m.202928 g.202928  ORF g.202928 m.202928 type:complete len:682 (-) comp25993_c0_seq1:25-2070(-)